MSYWQSVLLGIVEGLTEFLPVSSTGHLTITEKLMGLPIQDAGITAYTAVIQIGAIIAVLLYFRTDIIRFARAFFRGIGSAEGRRDPEWKFVLFVIAGSIPIGIAGLAFKNVIEGPLRSLRLSFFLSIPALVAAGALLLPDAVGGTGVGVGLTLVGTVVSFVVGYFSIAFLLRFVASHSIAAFVPYRVVLGGGLLVLLAAGVTSAT